MGFYCGNPPPERQEVKCSFADGVRDSQALNERERNGAENMGMLVESVGVLSQQSLILSQVRDERRANVSHCYRAANPSRRDRMSKHSMSPYPRNLTHRLRPSTPIRGTMHSRSVVVHPSILHHLMEGASGRRLSRGSMT